MVEFLGGDLAFFHGFPEIACVGAILFHGFLQFTGRTGNGVGKLVPVLGGEFSSTRGLRHDEADRFERLRVSARNSVQVTGGFGELIVALYTIGCELRGNGLNIVELVNRAVRIGARAFCERVDFVRTFTGECERLLEFDCGVGSVECFFCDAAECDCDAADGESSERSAGDFRYRFERSTKPGRDLSLGRPSVNVTDFAIDTSGEASHGRADLNPCGPEIISGH